MTQRSPLTEARRSSTGRICLICLAAWAVPGLGHLLLGKRKGTVFMAALPLMFIVGLYLQGRLYPLDVSAFDSIIYAIGDHGIGLLYFVAKSMGYGVGRVATVTFEYGNVYLAVSGLLNILVVLDAFDVSLGRK
jgi:hypothetical protein